jgi:hypothetical protein
MITPHDLADTDSFAGPERPPRAAPPPFSPALALADANTVASHEDPGSDMSSKGIAPTDAATSASGPRIGRYVLLSKLGEGGMGEVFAGYDRELDRRVALKVVRSRRVDDAHSQARMHREAQALARLSHPNVVQVHDVGEIGGQLFVAMEYVKGETLRTWQGRHDPTTPAGRRLILDMYVQAGRGLAAAHDAGLVARERETRRGTVTTMSRGYRRSLPGSARTIITSTRAFRYPNVSLRPPQVAVCHPL